MNAVCGETDDESARLRAVTNASFERMERVVVGTPPSVEEATDELGAVPEPTPATLDAGEWPQAISDSPDTLNDFPEQLSDRVGIDEVIIRHVVCNHADALQSNELFADRVDLTPR
ncbi:alkanal monooxygenase-like protein [Haloarcula marismortui ATCC 33799]|uniref:Alkanal monooxygenase-like protein n=1 Tax=Haloarcula marismortui ATCC 33799 TaxID=662475 RepID=M0JZ52_9EURY|nr:alkanal monooxygenase-like protein [Haloarcula californiae ATCC 33799]